MIRLIRTKKRELKDAKQQLQTEARQNSQYLRKDEAKQPGKPEYSSSASDDVLPQCIQNTTT
jgi:hypothetical protein